MLNYGKLDLPFTRPRLTYVKLDPLGLHSSCSLSTGHVAGKKIDPTFLHPTWHVEGEQLQMKSNGPNFANPWLIDPPCKPDPGRHILRSIHLIRELFVLSFFSILLSMCFLLIQIHLLIVLSIIGPCHRRSHWTCSIRGINERTRMLAFGYIPFGYIYIHINGYITSSIFFIQKCFKFNKVASNFRI